MIENEPLADQLPDKLRRLQGVLDRLSNLCIGICQEERALFATLLQVLRQGSSESADAHNQILAAYWKLYDWAVTVIVEDGVEATGDAIRECIIERVCSARHPFLVRCEREDPERVSRYLRQVFCRDLHLVQQLAQADWLELVELRSGTQLERSGDSDAATGELPRTSADKNTPLKNLKVHLRTSLNWDADWLDIAHFVNEHGLPPFRTARAFCICVDGCGVNLAPIKNFASFPLDWLEGNEERIEVLLRNTRHMLAGNRAHNMLIWGPRGGGKSSLIRGLIDVYYDQGLRGIEIVPEDYVHLRSVFDIIRGRREFFIGVLDNISLARGDSSLHHLSRVLDGGLEAVPANMVFYATSNFKDLVDREGARAQGLGVMQMESEGATAKISTGIRPDFYDPQQNQRIDELRALDDRFALKVFIDLPRKSEYENMVLSYAKRAGLTIPARELLAQFNMWRMRHNHDLVGGRTARDFVLDLVSHWPDR